MKIFFQGTDETRFLQSRTIKHTKKQTRDKNAICIPVIEISYSCTVKKGM